MPGARPPPGLSVRSRHADQQPARCLWIEHQRAEIVFDAVETNATTFEEVRSVPLETAEARAACVLARAGKERDEAGPNANGDVRLLGHLMGVTGEREPSDIRRRMQTRLYRGLRRAAVQRHHRRHGRREILRRELAVLVRRRQDAGADRFREPEGVADTQW